MAPAASGGGLTMRLIDADSLIEDLELLAKHEESFRQSVILGVVHTIKARSTIDAVPVVRCKDCIYSYEDFGFIHCTFGPYGDFKVPSQFYCAEGKRKENK